MLSLPIMSVSIRLSHFIGAIDNPVDRSVHAAGMPRLGVLARSISIQQALRG